MKSKPMHVCCGNGYMTEPHKGFDGKVHVPKPQKLWALVEWKKREIMFWGNGKEFQATIFPTRSEAKRFKKRNDAFEKLTLVRVQIQEVKRKK